MIKLSEKNILFRSGDRSEYAIDLKDLVKDIQKSENCYCFYVALSSFQILTDQTCLPGVLNVSIDTADVEDYNLVGQNSRNDIVYRHTYTVNGIYHFLFIIMINDLIKF